MRLFVLGATGQTGQPLVRQALARGHQVTALLRSPEKLQITHDHLRVLKGDPLDEAQLSAALAGHDAVISALGGNTLKPTTLLGDAAATTVAAMRKSGVRRVLVVSAALLFGRNGLLGAILRWILKNPMRDSKVMEERVESSDLDWTVARPPRLLNGRAKQRYQTAYGRTIKGSIDRADLATFLLDAVEKGEHVKKVVGVSA